MKIKNSIIAACMLPIISLTAFAMPFKDVAPNTEQGMAIEKLWSKGYVNGYNENTFAPNNTLTRAEFVKIVNNVFVYTEGTKNPFSDVSESDWFYKDVIRAAQAEYIRGKGNGLFAPNDQITREEVCKIINNILNMGELPVSVEISDAVSGWAIDSVKAVVGSGLASLEEGNKFRATEPITRGEAAVILSKCVVDVPDIEVLEPIDLESLADDVLEERLNAVITALNEEVLPLCYLDEQRGVVKAIAASMGEYLKDRSFDYKKAREETFKIYASMEVRNDRVALQNMITKCISLNDLLILYDFFFPEEEMTK